MILFQNNFPISLTLGISGREEKIQVHYDAFYLRRRPGNTISVVTVANIWITFNTPEALSLHVWDEQSLVPTQLAQCIFCTIVLSVL